MGAEAKGSTALTDSTVADSTLEGFTQAGSTVASPARTMASAASMKATGFMAGAADAMAGGGVTGWDGLIIHMVMTMATTTTASLTPTRPGTTAPILQAITLMSLSVTSVGRRFRRADAE